MAEHDPSPSPAGSTAIPTLRYRDAPAMITWLSEVFGFREHLVVPDGEGGIAHAQLILGGGMLMIGSARNDEWGAHHVEHSETGGRETRSPYLIVTDVDACATRAESRGGVLLRGPLDENHGGRSFLVRDPEGFLWNVGDYNPWLSA